MELFIHAHLTTNVFATAPSPPDTNPVLLVNHSRRLALSVFCFFFVAVAEQNLAQVRAQGWRAAFLYLICFVTLLSCHLSGVRHRVDSAGRRRRFPLRLRRAHVQTTLRSFSPSHALSSANKATVLSFPIWIKKTSVIAQIRAQRVWQVDAQKKQQKKKKTWLIISVCQSSSAPAHLCRYRGHCRASDIF